MVRPPHPREMAAPRACGPSAPTHRPRAGLFPVLGGRSGVVTGEVDVHHVGVVSAQRRTGHDLYGSHQMARGDVVNAMTQLARALAGYYGRGAQPSPCRTRSTADLMSIVCG